MSESLRNLLLKLVLLASIAGATTGASCADLALEPQAATCVVDEECADTDQICFRGECVSPCVTDEDCAEGVCRSEVRSEQADVVDVCRPDDVNSIAMECASDDDCASAFPGSSAQCGIDGSCFIPAFSLLIRDTTVDPTTDDGGLGADIAAVYIADPATGAPVAWGDVISLESDASDGMVAPDGSAVALTQDFSCVDAAYEEAATPLGGEGGAMLVRFLEGVTGDTVTTPPSTWNVVVVEWGANCPGGELGEPDSYDVYACAAASHKSTDADRDCGELLASAPTGGRITIAAEEK